jgi:hypothetical protein
MTESAAPPADPFPAPRLGVPRAVRLDASSLPARSAMPFRIPGTAARDTGARARRGSALPLALVMLVVLSTLAAGAFTASQQSMRGGRNALVEQRALAVAEFGLNQRMARWLPRLNLPPGQGGLATGAVDDSSVFVASGDTARVRITRLNAMQYLIESVGRASIPNPQLTSVRSVSVVARLAYPTIVPKGAVTSGGSVVISGTSSVDGRDTVPTGWTAAECAGLRGANVPAVVIPTNGGGSNYSVRTAGSGAILSGSNDWVRDIAARDSNTYVRYGSESWNSLASNAIRLPAGTYGSDIQPTENDGTCWTSNPGVMNWGEPFRGAGSIASCQQYFPIVYVDGTLTLNGRGRGQGILLVNGDLRITGTFDWVGLVIVRDDINKGTGTATITGSLLARNAVLGDSASVWAGNQDVAYSKCAVESALRGSAILVRTRERAWTQLY